MKRLTKTQKAKNKAIYKEIRKGYNKTGGEITYMAFKHRVEARMVSEGTNVRQAVRKELNTETFTSAADRSRANLIEALKTDFKDVYEDLRMKSREKGKFKSLKENLTWDSQRNGYVVGNKYFIDVSNSPEEIHVYAI